MGELVEMRHPKIEDAIIRVPESGVFHRERAGWERVNPKAKGKPANTGNDGKAND